MLAAAPAALDTLRIAAVYPVFLAWQACSRRSPSDACSTGVADPPRCAPAI
jgi:hypothetical protein